MAMDGCSSWETRLMLPQWSNDPWSSMTPNSGQNPSSILDPIAEEGFVDSEAALLTSSFMSSPLSEPGGLTGIDGSGSGSTSGSLNCLLSASNSKTDPTSVEDDGVSLIFSDCTQKRKDKNSGFDLTGPSKRVRRGNMGSGSSSGSGVNISFRQGSRSEPDAEAIQQMKEMIYRAAAFRPVSFGPEKAAAEKPKRRNVRISSDPQTVAARKRRERISERLRVLQKLVPGGSKMDTASMLDEAANYLKFLRNQVKALEAFGGDSSSDNTKVIDHLNPYGSRNYQLSPPINLPFSSLPLIPMQECAAFTPVISLQNPTHVHLP